MSAQPQEKSIGRATPAKLFAAAAVVTATLASSAGATTYQFTRGAGNNNWDSALNWTSPDGTPPPPENPLPEGAVTDLLFTGTLATFNSTTTIRRAYTLNSITFRAPFVYQSAGGTSSYGISTPSSGTGSADVTLGAGGIAVDGEPVGNINFNYANPASSYTGAMFLSADQTWNINIPSTSNRTFGMFRPLTGSATLTKTGPGILILSKTNGAYTGNIVLHQGTIRTGGSASDPNGHFGTGTVIHESEHDVSITASTVSSDNFGGGGGGADRTFSNDFRLGGTGELSFGGSFNINLTADSTVTLTSDKTIAFGNNTASPTYVMDAKFTGGFGFTKIGVGTVLLNNVANDYTGVTRFGDGVVVVSHPHQLGDGSATNNLAFDGGTLRVTAPLSTARSIAVDDGGGTIDTQANDVTISGGMTATAAGTGTLRKAGSGTLTLPHVRAGGGIAVDGGKVFLTANGTDAGVSKVGSVDTTGGTLDLNDNDLVVDYADADPSPADALRLQLKAGRDSAWAGPGIVSTAAKNNASGLTAIGYAAAGDVLTFTGGSATWGGQIVDVSSVLLKYTYYGDANLSGWVDRDDLALADRGAAMGLTGWRNGDFDYDGVAGTAADYLLMDKSYAANGGALSPDFLASREGQFGAGYVSQLIAAVPEPSGAAAAIGIGALLTTRRRHNRG